MTFEKKTLVHLFRKIGRIFFLPISMKICERTYESDVFEKKKNRLCKKIMQQAVVLDAVEREKKY